MFFKQSQKDQDKERFLRPDLYYQKKRQEIDQLIREDIVPDILADFELELEGRELIDGRFILPRNLTFIYNTAKNNGALLAMFFNISLKNHIGDSRDSWKLDDYDEAIKFTNELADHIRSILTKHLGGV